MIETSKKMKIRIYDSKSLGIENRYNLYFPFSKKIAEREGGLGFYIAFTIDKGNFKKITQNINTNEKAKGKKFFLGTKIDIEKLPEGIINIVNIFEDLFEKVLKYDDDKSWDDLNKFIETTN